MFRPLFVAGLWSHGQHVASIRQDLKVAEPVRVEIPCNPPRPNTKCYTYAQTGVSNEQHEPAVCRTITPTAHCHPGVVFKGTVQEVRLTCKKTCAAILNQPTLQEPASSEPDECKHIHAQFCMGSFVLPNRQLVSKACAQTCAHLMSQHTDTSNVQPQVIGHIPSSATTTSNAGVSSPLGPVCPPVRPTFGPSDAFHGYGDMWDKTRQPNPAHPGYQYIVAFGDSLTEGKDCAKMNVAPEFTKNYDRSCFHTMTPWPNFLQQILNEQGQRYQVLNRGVYGQTLENINDRVPKDLRGPGSKVKIVTVMAGTNNLWSATEADIDRVFALEMALHRRIQSTVPGATLVVMAIPQGGRTRAGTQIVDTLNQKLKDDADTNGKIFVDVGQIPYNGWSGDGKDSCGNKMMYDDSTHFASDGYRQIANLVYNSIVEVL